MLTLQKERTGRRRQMKKRKKDYKKRSMTMKKNENNKVFKDRRSLVGRM